MGFVATLLLEMITLLKIGVLFGMQEQKFMIGAFARYDNLDGAVFEDSPLVETREYFVFGMVFAWVLGASDETVGH